MVFGLGARRRTLPVLISVWAPISAFQWWQQPCTHLRRSRSPDLFRCTMSRERATTTVMVIGRFTTDIGVMSGMSGSGMTTACTGDGTRIIADGTRINMPAGDETRQLFR